MGNGACVLYLDRSVFGFVLVWVFCFLFFFYFTTFIGVKTTGAVIT